MCSNVIPKSVNFNLYKNSFVGYTLNALGLQDKFKHVAGWFLPK